MNVQNVGSNFNWKWYLKDLKDISKKNIKVFSCFICGMSVPPNMLANISKEIYKQWLER